MDLLDELGPLLGRAHAAHRAIAERELAALGLQPKGYGALLVLAAEGPLTQQRLAERQGIDRTTTVAVVDALEAAGLVERRRRPDDRRANALHVTPAGRRAMTRASEATARAEDAFLAPLPAAERRRLKAALRRLVEADP